MKAGKWGRSHGHARGPRSLPANKRTSPTWKTWWSMISRCRYSTMGSSVRYLEAGIMVCERWQRFENFLVDMGERPPGTTLDRFPDRNGNYEPGNCRWATAAEQAQNRCTTKLNEDLANEILGRFEVGENRRSISRRLGLGYQLVWAVCDGKTWPQLDRPYLRQ